jgi:hypothetical protein
MSTSAPIPIIQSNLVFCLDAGNTKSYPGSGTNWFDLTKNNNKGALTNGPTFNSANGGSIVFDGIDDTVNITPIDLRTTFTYESWVNMNTVNGFAFLGQGTTTNNNGLHIWYISATSIRFGMHANDTDVTSLTTAANTWYHYAFTYSHTTPYTKEIYINAIKQIGTPQQTQAQYTGTGTLRIGATYSSAGNYATGKIAYSKFYNRILTATEILQNYNATKSRFGL